MKKPFNPNDFFDTVTVKDIANKFPELLDMDFKEFSLNDELVKRNYELISRDYVDKKYSSLKDYFDLEVDPVV
jgi:hypothetical protein